MDKTNSSTLRKSKSGKGRTKVVTKVTNKSGTKATKATKATKVKDITKEDGGATDGLTQAPVSNKEVTSSSKNSGAVHAVASTEVPTFWEKFKQLDNKFTTQVLNRLNKPFKPIECAVEPLSDLEKSKIEETRKFLPVIDDTTKRCVIQYIMNIGGNITSCSENRISYYFPNQKLPALFRGLFYTPHSLTLCLTTEIDDYWVYRNHSSGLTVTVHLPINTVSVALLYNVIYSSRYS